MGLRCVASLCYIHWNGYLMDKDSLLEHESLLFCRDVFMYTMHGSVAQPTEATDGLAK